MSVAPWLPPYDPATVAAVAAALPGARTDQPLAAWTTLGVGGPARVYVEPADERELAEALRVLGRFPEEAVPLLVLGRGSNLLVGDRGWPSVALRLGAGFKGMARVGDDVTAGGAAAMPALAAWLATEGLAGLEFAAGIPATVGGSVRMNAGAHGGQVADRLVDASIASPDAPLPAPVPAAALGFGYRRSALPPRAVVTAARWALAPDDPLAIRARLDELRAWRRATQPLRQRNCGSVFTNPPGDSAGRLVDAAGLKGHRVGGARVSEKHANFVVVEPDARASDVLALVVEVRRLVAEAGGPVLEPEVRVVGEFG